MYDWNKDGKIDMVDHWITHNIINYEKENRELDIAAFLKNKNNMIFYY